MRHHLLDVRRQLPAVPALSPAEREARWQLSALFAIDAPGESEARAVLSQALAALDDELPVRGDPVIRSRNRQPGRLWIAELRPDLTWLPEIEPDDATTRCKYVTSRLAGGVIWAVPRQTRDEARYDWPPAIWDQQPGSDEMLLHPAVLAVMIYCTAANSPHAC